MIALGKPARTEVELHELIRERWSPRAFTPAPVPREALQSVIEAARWAPSSNNEQPWTLLIGDRDRDPAGHARLLACLVPANAEWAAAAAVLLLAVARLTFQRNGRPNRFAMYDTGQAMAQLALQATALGLSAHQMAGYDVERARELLGIPDGHETAAMMALGYRGDPSTLSETQRERELAQRDRRPKGEWVFGAGWGTPLPG
jgi:nitroreductase